MWVSEHRFSAQPQIPTTDCASRENGRLSLYFTKDVFLIRVMDLKNLTNEELERLLKILPEEIRRRESQVDELEEAERRKRNVFASFQELAKKQGVSLADL